MADLLAPGRWGSTTGGDSRRSRLTRWAIGVSAVSGAAFASSVTIVAISYSMGGEDAIEDTWLGAFLAAVAAVGLVGSFGAFVLAVVASVKHERGPLLSMPLCLFPAFVVFLVLGEALWWE
jgi:hypothetical protein